MFHLVCQVNRSKRQQCFKPLLSLPPPTFSYFCCQLSVDHTLFERKVNTGFQTRVSLSWNSFYSFNNFCFTLQLHLAGGQFDRMEKQPQREELHLKILTPSTLQH